MKKLLIVTFILIVAFGNKESSCNCGGPLFEGSKHNSKHDPNWGISRRIRDWNWAH